MPGPENAMLAIGVMALVTCATRFGGVWIVQRAELPASGRCFTEMLGMTLLAALVAPAAVSSDAALLGGVTIAGFVAGILRRPLASMVLAVATTAGVRAMGL